MNAIRKTSITWNGDRCVRRNTNSLRRISWAIAVLLGALSLKMALGPASAAGPDTTSLVTLVQTGQGAAAVEQVAAAALERGGWAPAPGDRVIFDSSLSPFVRGKIQVVDQTPAECASAKFSRLMDDCTLDFETGEELVRFGDGLFTNPVEGNSLPRPNLDDVLSTYIEEVGHSWQEYLFETDGAGGGERVHATSYEDGLYWGPGWEYQVKMYLLALDGDLLSLSAEERAILKASICAEDGYANPIGHHVPPYGPPPGWPRPDAWPVSDPAPDAFQAFCAMS